MCGASRGPDRCRFTNTPSQAFRPQKAACVLNEAHTPPQELCIPIWCPALGLFWGHHQHTMGGAGVARTMEGSKQDLVLGRGKLLGSCWVGAGL